LLERQLESFEDFTEEEKLYFSSGLWLL
jgi:hypothetical protein